MKSFGKNRLLGKMARILDAQPTRGVPRQVIYHVGQIAGALWADAADWQSAPAGQKQPVCLTQKSSMMRGGVRMGVFPVLVNSLGGSHDMRVGGSDDIRVLACVGNGVKDMLHRVETCAILVVGAYNRPRRIRGVRVKEHRFF